jgi:hypothetical protein
MKRMMAIALLALAGFTAAGSAHARGQQPQYLAVLYGSFQQRGACNIDGDVFPVAMDYTVRAHDAYGNWFIIGRVIYRYADIWRFLGRRGEDVDVKCW